MTQTKRTVAIVGAGLSGAAAAVRLWDLAKELEHRGSSMPLEIHLFEASAILGGRASSRFLPEEDLLLDGAQHLTMNCCTAMLEFLRRTDLLRFWKLQTEMTFCVRSGASETAGPLRFFPFRNSASLPQPFHLLPALWGLGHLNRLERLQLLGICRQIQKSTPNSGDSFRAWMEKLGCPASVADHFFDPVILSAFSDQMENVSAGIAKTVFRRMFLETKDGWHFWIPQCPLREIFDANLTPFLERSGIRIHRQTPVRRIVPGRLLIQDTKSGLRSEFAADSVILAVPWFQAGKLLPELVSLDLFQPERFEPRTISAVHFWTDRVLFPQPNLVLPRETIQWIFRPPFGPEVPNSAHHSDGLQEPDPKLRFLPENVGPETCSPAERVRHGFYHQVLLSDADRCVSAKPQALEQLVRAELQMLFPEARFLHFRTTRCPAAVFSCSTWMEHSRPTMLTPFPSIFLAGDWTATQLPATMESAVVSGSLAAEETFHFLKNLHESK